MVSPNGIEPNQTLLSTLQHVRYLFLPCSSRAWHCDSIASPRMVKFGKLLEFLRRMIAEYPTMVRTPCATSTSIANTIDGGCLFILCQILVDLVFEQNVLSP